MTFKLALDKVKECEVGKIAFCSQAVTYVYVHVHVYVCVHVHVYVCVHVCVHVCVCLCVQCACVCAEFSPKGAPLRFFFEVVKGMPILL